MSVCDCGIFGLRWNPALAPALVQCARVIRFVGTSEAQRKSPRPNAGGSTFSGPSIVPEGRLPHRRSHRGHKWLSCRALCSRPSDDPRQHALAGRPLARGDVRTVPSRGVLPTDRWPEAVLVRAFRPRMVPAAGSSTLARGGIG